MCLVIDKTLKDEQDNSLSKGSPDSASEDGSTEASVR